jgi:N-acetyltransferase 10
LTSKPPNNTHQSPIPTQHLTQRNRYEIEDSAPGWEDAEKQILKATKSGQSVSAVSVKSNKAKRKEGPTAAEVYEEEFGEKEKKHKRAKKEGGSSKPSSAKKGKK